MKRTPALITPQGKQHLGKIIKASRERLHWSIDDLIKQVELMTGFKMSKSTISQLERGVPDPKWDTLSVLASVGFIRLSESSPPLSTEELFRIATESLDPEPPKANDSIREGKEKPKTHVYDSGRNQAVRLMMVS